jgi:glycosyltransferase involved in cell wall biosynthesis
VTRLWAVVPEGIDDPRRPSGGNVYDRRMLAGLSDLGWDVVECRGFGALPRGLPADALVLADGMVVAEEPDAALAAAERHRLAVLAHMVWGRGEAVLRSAQAIVATSDSTGRALERSDGRVHVVPPGVDPAPLSDGCGLIAVGAVVPDKGHDILLSALRGLGDLEWTCTIVGSLEVDPDFAAGLVGSGLATFTGPLFSSDLDDAYAAAGLLVLPSLHEGYGMVLTEGLARGLPAVAADVGGVREALGATAAGLPGLLVRPGDRVALMSALRAWLTDPELRARLRRAAMLRRVTLPPWSAAAAEFSAVLAAVADREPFAR